MSGRADNGLTLLERAKVAAAVGATMQLPGKDLAALVVTAQEAIPRAEALMRSAGQMKAAAEGMAAAAEQVHQRGRTMLRLSVVAFGLGLGFFVAGLIL